LPPAFRLARTHAKSTAVTYCGDRLVGENPLRVHSSSLTLPRHRGMVEERHGSARSMWRASEHAVFASVSNASGNLVSIAVIWNRKKSQCPRIVRPPSCYRPLLSTIARITFLANQSFRRGTELGGKYGLTGESSKRSTTATRIFTGAKMERWLAQIEQSVARLSEPARHRRPTGAIGSACCEDCPSEREACGLTSSWKEGCRDAHVAIE
jgi:hypothetical protein